MLIALLLVAGAFLVASFWRELAEWLQSVLKAAAAFVDAVVQGTKVFIKRLKDRFEQKAKTWYQDKDREWHERTQTRTVSADEVPEEIRNKARVYNKEVDITRELEEQLELAH